MGYKRKRKEVTLAMVCFHPVQPRLDS